MHMPLKNTVILYHGKCPDGFGAAFSAWKKFGENADYIPVDHGDSPPSGLEGREVYIVDFCYETKEQMETLAKIAKKLVVLDHHESDKELTESVAEHVYDVLRSGASIAWTYFHPEMRIPRLMKYLEDGDLYNFALPETRNVFSYLLVLPFDFQQWDTFASELENDSARTRILEKAKAYTEFFEALVHMSADRAKKVSFEGYEVYFVATHPNITFKSRVASVLYKKFPPFAMIVTAHPNGYGVSLRGDDTVDVSKIAQKYGGGGHTGSAGFFVPNGNNMPWKEINE